MYCRGLCFHFCPSVYVQVELAQLTWSCFKKFLTNFDAVWQQGYVICLLSTARWSLAMQVANLFYVKKKSDVQISCLLPWNGLLHIMYLHMSSTDLQFALLHYRAMHGHAISAFLEALEFFCFFLVFFQLKSSLLCPTQWSTYHTHTYMHTQALTSGWKHKLWVCAFMHLYVDVAVCVVCNLSGRKGKTKLKLKNLRKNL